MTMNQQEKDALSQNWQQAKSQIQAQFPDLTEDDLSQGESSPDQLASTVANKTGQDRNSVEQSLRQIAQQFQGGTQS